MSNYSRKPALLILVVSVALGALYLKAWGSSRSGADDLERLEVAIASGRADAATWYEYGQRLQQLGRYAHAVTAYRMVLEVEPYHRDARFNRGLALACDGDADAFYSYMRETLLGDAKLAVDILQQQPCQKYLSEPRMAALQKEAEHQAMD